MTQSNKLKEIPRLLLQNALKERTQSGIKIELVLYCCNMHQNIIGHIQKSFWTSKIFK